MNLFGIPRQVELWRQTTPEITGWNATPQFSAIVETTDGPVAVSLRDCALPSVTAWLRGITGVQSRWLVEPPVVAPLILRSAPVLAVMEHPAQRVARVWRYYINNELARAREPLRFSGVYGLCFADFIRWLMHQDSLGVDPLLRPQWAMMPERAELFEVTHDSLSAMAARLCAGAVCPFDPAGESLPQPGAAVREILQIIYRDDFVLWEKYFA